MVCNPAYEEITLVLAGSRYQTILLGLDEQEPQVSVVRRYQLGYDMRYIWRYRWPVDTPKTPPSSHRMAFRAQPPEAFRIVLAARRYDHHPSQHQEVRNRELMEHYLRRAGLHALCAWYRRAADTHRNIEQI